MTPHQPHPGGRPRKFNSPEEIDELSKAYFTECDLSNPKVPYTVTGLAESLGTFRIVLSDYESGKYDVEADPENGVEEVRYSYAIKRAKAKIERYAEEHVYDKTAGSVFTLVNITRNQPEPWKNAQQQDVNHSGSIEVGLIDRLKEARERAAGR